MGYKYDENNDEWVTTKEWNERKLAAVGVAILMGLFALILPARIIKWMLGYGFFPDISFWQMAGDVCISIPIYLVIVGILVAMMGNKSGTL